MRERMHGSGRISVPVLMAKIHAPIEMASVRANDPLNMRLKISNHVVKDFIRLLSRFFRELYRDSFEN
jgi:hypothetical protein